MAVFATIAAMSTLRDEQEDDTQVDEEKSEGLDLTADEDPIRAEL